MIAPSLPFLTQFRLGHGILPFMPPENASNASKPAKIDMPSESKKAQKQKKAKRDIGILKEEAGFCLGYLRGKEARLVVSLSGVGKQRNIMPPFEFVKMASQKGRNHVLFASDITRSWMNNSEFVLALTREITALKERENIRKIIAIGNSMGAFAAIVLARLVPVDRVVAFGPQFSVSPKTLPEERRWWYFQSQIERFEFEDIGELRTDIPYYIFHGDAKEEEPHWRRFPKGPNIHHYIFKAQDHNLARALKREGALRPIMRFSINDRPHQLRNMLMGRDDVFERT